MSKSEDYSKVLLSGLNYPILYKRFNHGTSNHGNKLVHVEKKSLLCRLKDKAKEAIYKCMNKAIKFYKGLIGLFLTLGGLLTSCVMEEDVIAKAGKADVRIELSTSADFEPTTKAVNESDYQNLNNYTVEIWQNETIKKSFPYTEKPASIELNNGTYTLKAYYGTKADYSRTGFYVEGATVFNIEGASKSVSCQCAPVVAKLKVNFTTDMATYFSDYKVIYTTQSITGTAVTWAKNDTDPWYIKVAQNGETVKATIQLTPKAEYVSKNTTTNIERTYALKPNEMWTLEIAPSYTTTKGQLGISINIDSSTNDKPIDIVIPAEWS